MNLTPLAPDDRRLVADYLARRDETSFLALYERHTDALYRFAARLSGGPGGDAEDIVQESWIRALEALARFRGESSLRTWLCGIVLNCWRARRDKSVRENRLALIPGGLAAESPRLPSEPPTVGRALEELADGYRAILILHDVEGYTHEEIARHLGIAPGTSKSQLHRARRALRQRLTGNREVTGDR